MSGRAFVIGIIVVMTTTVFAGLVGAGTNTTTNYLPMPYGKGNLTLLVGGSRFGGVRLHNNNWYTFVWGNNRGKEDYSNDGYPDYSDVYTANKQGEPEDKAYYFFTTDKLDHPQEVYGEDDQYQNHKDGVTGVLGVNISSYHDDGGKTLDIIVDTLYKDNYVDDPSHWPLTTTYINDNKGRVYDDYSYYYTRNYFYRAKIYIEKINASDTAIDFNSPSTSSNTFGFNAHPGTDIKYTDTGGEASNIAKYLLMEGIKKGTDVATDGVSEIGWASLGVIENEMKTGNSGDDPWQTAPAGYDTAYYNWAEKVPNQETYAVQSVTQTEVYWRIYSEVNDAARPLGLKIHAGFWYMEPSDYGDSDYKYFETSPIYIWVIPKRIGVGIPTPPVPSGYNGAGISYDTVWTGVTAKGRDIYQRIPVYNKIPSTFKVYVNKEFTIKTADVAYGFNGNDGKMLPATIKYKIDWGDGATSIVGPDDTSVNNNGKIIEASHTYTEMGTYHIRVCAKAHLYDGEWHPVDDSWNGGWGPWSRTTKIHVVDGWKSAPTAPYAPAGGSTFYTDSSGHASVTFVTSSARTYSGCKIRYTFIWDDGTSTTTGWLSFGASAQATHSFTVGTYHVKVEAEAATKISPIYSSSTTITVENPPSPPPGGGGGGGSCVDPYTPILMADGTYEFAKDIQIGDVVMTYNFTTGEYENGTVENITITHEDEEYVINGVLGIAKDQEVWTSRGWVEAQNLTTYDWIYNVYTGTWTRVYDITVIQENIDMYDFHISNNQNYVGWMYLLEDWGGIHAC